MRALTIVPGRPDSARLDDVPEPASADGTVLVETLAVGVCGTDLELASGRFGRPPAGRERLILGHESLGRVLEAPEGGRLSPGDLVVGIVRRPEPPLCAACAADEWDMCRDGRFTEHGIVGRDGFCAERFRSDPEFLVRVDPRLGRLGVLLEPASVVAKAWEHLDQIVSRSLWRPKRVLVTGAGPIGLLAALLGTQREYDVSVIDQVIIGPKPELARDLGATYRSGAINDAARGAEIMIECTGSSDLIAEAIQRAAAGAIGCLLGSCHGTSVALDLGAFSAGLIGGNGVLFGCVNSNRRHYAAAAAALGAADPEWLHRLVTRRVPLDRWSEALGRSGEDVKAVVELSPNQ